VSLRTWPVTLPTYTVVLPATLKLINLNETKGGRWVKGPKAKAIRAAAAETVAALPRMTRVHITCYVTRGRLGDKWDPFNWAASAKPAVDGFVEAGMLPDDNITHVVGPDMRGRRGVKHPPFGLLEFVIADLSEVAGDGFEDA
jgi:crossover junction endodeoxyribonuclease RusA